MSSQGNGRSPGSVIQSAQPHTREHKASGEQIAALTWRRLMPEHVEAVVRLEQETFPAAFHLGAAAYYYFLSTAELKGQNYSVGVFDKDDLVGYTLMVQHPSDFYPGREVPYVISMAVRFRYRRTAVKPLLEWMLREACVTGQDVEGKMREATAFRMIQRNWKLFRHYHFRVTGIKEIERAEKDRMILVRFEHTFRRDRVVWSAYHALTQIERTRRMVAALPQRTLRKICRLLPHTLVTPQLRRLSYLEQPEAAQQ